MLKAFIFDMDGVLVDSMPYHVDAWISTLNEIGINISRQDLYDIEGSNNEGLINLVFSRNGRTPGPHDYEDLAKRKNKIFNGINKIHPYKGMVDCLDQLKKKYRLGVVSGSDNKIVHLIINKFFSEVFDIVISGDDVKEGKPSPEPYLKAAEMLGFLQDEYIVIENAIMGVESAKSAGLYCVAVASYIEPKKLEKADLIFKEHSELVKYLGHYLT
jgi:beta-phosphoglucomutase